MTYLQLRAKLASLSEEELQQTATVRLTESDEFTSIERISILNDSDGLDPGLITLDIRA